MSRKIRKTDQTALLDDDSLAPVTTPSTSRSAGRSSSKASKPREAPPPEVEEEDEEEPKGFFASKTNIIGAIVSVLVIIAIIAGVAWFLLSASPDAPPAPIAANYWGQVLLANVNATEIGINFHTVTQYTTLTGTVPSQGAVRAVQAAFTAAFAGNASLATVALHNYNVLLNYPTGYNPDNPQAAPALASRSLSIVKPVNGTTYLASVWTSSLQEDPLPLDDATKRTDYVPTFNGYSPSTNGPLTAAAFYVNYGTLEDYQLLDAWGFNMSGKIAVARYGQNFRGIKAAIGERFGVAGVLIYSDPLDDGYNLGPMYTDGSYRPFTGVQRGSAEYISHFSGDPLTPFCPAGFPGCVPLYGYNASNIVGNVTRSPVLPGIPVQPISYADAYQILANLTGTPISGTNIPFPASWAGGFSPSAKNAQGAFPPFVQRIGLTSVQDGVTNATQYSPLLVQLTLSMTFVQRTITDVCLSIHGSVEDEKWVVLGNHRDAWVYGGVDPHQGTAAMMELARVLGVMASQGWQPRRRLILCSWDGEEQALLGSTEWVEEHMQAGFPLQQSAVAYINVDVAIEGDSLAVLGVSASPSLGDIALDTAKAVSDPWQAAAGTNQSLYQSAMNAVNGRAVMVSELGSGSDFTPFMQFAGISSLTLEFGPPRDSKANGYGVYHSIYDSEDYSNNWMDKGHLGKLAMAQYWGYLAIRLTDAEVLPFNFSAYSARIDQDLKAVEDYAANQSLPVQFAALDAAVAQFRWAAGNLSDPAVFPTNASWYGANVTYALNTYLHQTEQKFLAIGDTFPDRDQPWYRHVLDAPGLWAGYAAQSFPGVHDAIQGPIGAGIKPGTDIPGRSVVTQQQIQQAATAVQAAATWLWQAVALLKSAPPPPPPTPSSTAAPPVQTSSSSSLSAGPSSSARTGQSSSVSSSSSSTGASVSSSSSSAATGVSSSSSSSSPVLSSTSSSSSSSNGTNATNSRWW